MISSSDNKPIPVDCTQIVAQIVEAVGKSNQGELDEMKKMIIAQQQQIDSLKPMLSLHKSQSGSSAHTSVGEVTVVTNNTPEGVRSQHTIRGESVSIDGSNQWFRSVKGEHRKRKASPESSKLDNKENKVIEDDQQFWYNASTHDYDDESKATGKEISSSLAGAAKVFWQKPLKQEALKGKLEEATTPANCGFLLPKRTNTEVWTNLPSFARSADVKLQEIQKIHTASVSMILKAASGLTEASNIPDESSLVKDTMLSLKEAMNLAGKTSQLLNQFRRDQIKPSLPRDFKKLAMDNDESSEWLFGSSVCDRLETLKKENKLTSLLEKEKGYKRKYEANPKETYGRSSNFRPSHKTQRRANDPQGQKFVRRQQDKKQKPRSSPPPHKKKFKN